jgi:hypothetical protein
MRLGISEAIVVFCCDGGISDTGALDGSDASGCGS